SRVVFFYQAEDGIRDFHVTGVQTCALPISKAISTPHQRGRLTALSVCSPCTLCRASNASKPCCSSMPACCPARRWSSPISAFPRSEERRVGKEGRPVRTAPGHRTDTGLQHS